MDEEQPQKPSGPPRRAFLSSAIVSLTSLAAGALSGCAREDIAPNAADDADLNSLRAVDPKFVAYRETRRIETGMAEPRGIAIAPDGSLIVVGDRRARWFLPKGAALTEFAVEGIPTAAAVAADGTLFLGMTDHLEVISREGKRLAAGPILGERAHITALAAGSSDVWAANAAGRVVLRCDRQGQITGRIGEKHDPDYPGLIIPSPHLDVALGAGETLLVTNPGLHRVETHAPDGRCLSYWGTAANTLDNFCGCCNPTNIARLPDGRVVTSEKGIPRVKVYSAEGKFLEVVAGPDAFAGYAMGLDLAAGPDGSIWVLDPPSKSVRLFTRLESKKT